MTAIRLLSLAASVFLLSEFAIGPLATSASPAPQLGPPVTVVAKTSPEDVARGKVLYEATCSKCHGLDGGGGDGPSLQGVPERLGDQATGAIIRGGIPGTGMNGFGSVNGDETGQVVGYLRTLGHTADTEVAKGDPQKGKAVYDASRCAACHIIDGVGGGIGPELTRVGAMRGPGYLHTALLAPGTNLPNEAGAMERGRFTQFLFVHVVEKNGHSVDGTRVSEDSFTIVIKDATGHFHAFRKLEVQQIDKLPGRSVMPSFKDTLSAAQLDDLVAYLASLKGAP